MNPFIDVMLLGKCRRQKQLLWTMPLLHNHLDLLLENGVEVAEVCEQLWLLLYIIYLKVVVQEEEEEGVGDEEVQEEHQLLQHLRPH